MGHRGDGGDPSCGPLHRTGRASDFTLRQESTVGLTHVSSTVKARVCRPGLEQPVGCGSDASADNIIEEEEEEGEKEVIV